MRAAPFIISYNIWDVSEESPRGGEAPEGPGVGRCALTPGNEGVQGERDEGEALPEDLRGLPDQYTAALYRLANPVNVYS